MAKKEGRQPFGLGTQSNELRPSTLLLGSYKTLKANTVGNHPKKLEGKIFAKKTTKTGK